MRPHRTITFAAFLALTAGWSNPSAARQGEEAALPTAVLAAEISPQSYAAMSAAGDQTLAPTLIDVRTPEEFAADRIAGATNIDWTGDDFAAQVAELPRDRPYVLYCRSGRRSAEAREAMVEMGFANVASMAGGIEAWRQGERPVVE